MANNGEASTADCGSEGRGFEPRRSPPEKGPWARANGTLDTMDGVSINAIGNAMLRGLDRAEE